MLLDKVSKWLAISGIFFAVASATFALFDHNWSALMGWATAAVWALLVLGHEVSS